MKTFHKIFINKFAFSLLLFKILLIVFLQNTGYTQSGTYSFQKAEKYYKNKDYKQAISFYSMAILCTRQ